MTRVACLLALLLAAAGVRAAPERPKDERDQVTRYHAHHVLVGSQDAAKKVHARIVAAGKGRPKQTLEALGGAAKELSGDAETAPRGGDLGRVLEGTYEERFERAVLALEPGTLSAPFESEYGWHVLFLAEKRAVPVSIVCGPTQPLESGDVARITVELGPSWAGPAATLAGVVSFLHIGRSSRGDAFREATLHRELPHAVLVASREPPACYRSMRTRFVTDCAHERIAGVSEEYFEARLAKGAMVDSIPQKENLADADFEPVPARGGARQVYDTVCEREPDAW